LQTATTAEERQRLATKWQRLRSVVALATSGAWGEQKDSPQGVSLREGRETGGASEFWR